MPAPPELLALYEALHGPTEDLCPLRDPTPMPWTKAVFRVVADGVQTQPFFCVSCFLMLYVSIRNARRDRSVVDIVFAVLLSVAFVVEMVQRK